MSSTAVPKKSKSKWANVTQEERDHALMDFAQKGDVEQVKELLLNGANKDFKDGFGTPLSHAISHKHVEVVKVLVNNGVDKEQLQNGETPLQKAIVNGASDIVKVLVNAGVNLETPNKSQDTPLQNAIWRGHVEIILTLLEAGANVLPSKWTPLHIAALKGDSEAIKTILHQTPAIIDNQDSIGCTALHIASEQGRCKAVKMLCDQGCDKNKVDEHKQTALHKAVLHRHVDVIKVLCECGANKELTDSTHHTALCIASETDHSLDLTRLLLSAGADPASMKWTPLHIAALKDDVESIKAVMTPGIINSQDLNGNTALHLASQYGFANVAEALCAGGAGCYAGPVCAADVAAVGDRLSFS